MLLSAEHLSINFGSRQLLEDVNFYLNEGDKVGVIGINGTGKSTFLKVLAGKLELTPEQSPEIPTCKVSLLEQESPHGGSTPPFWSRYSCISPRNSGS